LFGRFRAQNFDPAFLACRDRRQLVALALTFIASRQCVLNGCVHTDFSPHKGALLIGGLLRLFRIDALLLRGAFLDKRLGKLGRKLLAAHGNQKLRRNRRFAETHFTDGDARRCQSFAHRCQRSANDNSREYAAGSRTETTSES
jgi:hypothetical protein